MYYQLYADNSEIPSKVAFDPEEPSLGRIRADSVAQPHSLASIKRRISIVEENPELVLADFFADISSDAPLKEGCISILGTDGPGLSPNEPMAIVLVKPPSIPPDGRYFIKNRAVDTYWSAGKNPIETVYFWPTSMDDAKKYNFYQVNELSNYSSVQRIIIFQVGHHT